MAAKRIRTWVCTWRLWPGETGMPVTWRASFSKYHLKASVDGSWVVYRTVEDRSQVLVRQGGGGKPVRMEQEALERAMREAEQAMVWDLHERMMRDLMGWV